MSIYHSSILSLQVQGLGRVDSNHRPADSKSDILPLNYFPKILCAVYKAGAVSPVHIGGAHAPFTAVRNLLRQTYAYDHLACLAFPYLNSGAARESRTPDILLTRQVLYQLSYCSLCVVAIYNPADRIVLEL